MLFNFSSVKHIFGLTKPFVPRVCHFLREGFLFTCLHPWAQKCECIIYSIVSHALHLHCISDMNYTEWAGSYNLCTVDISSLDHPCIAIRCDKNCDRHFPEDALINLTISLAAFPWPNESLPWTTQKTCQEEARINPKHRITQRELHSEVLHVTCTDDSRPTTGSCPHSWSAVPKPHHHPTRVERLSQET